MSLTLNPQYIFYQLEKTLIKKNKVLCYTLLPINPIMIKIFLGNNSTH